MKQNIRKWTEIGRKGMALLLALVMVLGVCMPVYATGDATEPTEPTTPETTLATEPETVETTAPAEPAAQAETSKPAVETSEPAVEPAEEEPSEPVTTVGDDAPGVPETTEPETTVPETTVGDDAPGVPETTEPETTVPETTVGDDALGVPDTTVPEQVVTDDEPVQSSAPEKSAYELAMEKLAAMAEEAKTLEKSEEALDTFTEDLYELANYIADLWDSDQITDDQYFEAENQAVAILAYLETTYGYVDGKVVLDVSASPTDIVTSNANGAIKFNLFSYSKEINYSDSEMMQPRPIAEYFNFRDSVNFPTGGAHTFNQSEYDTDGFPKNHTIVEPKLVNGYPVVDLYNYANGTHRETNLNNTVTQDVRSLSYLFDPAGKDHAVTAYTPKNSILHLNNGRYQYASANNAVDYNTTTNEFYVRNYVERTLTTAGYSGYSDFMPFVYTNGNRIGTTDAGIGWHIGNSYTDASKPVDYWYGMVMEVDFYMPKDGKVNGEDMQFYFSGDDDVWVFIDDVLVLDLGGTHGTVDGSINFATGEVQQYLSWQRNVTEDEKKDGSTNSFPTTLKTRYTNAETDPNGGWDATGNTFADYSKHTLKFFYLERGGGVANCKLDFNLPTLPPGGASVTKELNPDSQVTDYTKDEKYTFQLVKRVNGEDVPVANKAYSIDNVNAGTTDAEGKFTIAPGKTATFAGLETDSAGVNYRIYEVQNSDKASLTDMQYSGGSDHTKGTNYIEFKVKPDDAENNITHQTLFTNTLNTTDVTVAKKVTGNMGDWSKEFTFTVALSDKDGTKIPFVAPDGDDKYTVNDGVATFKLKHGEEINLDDIPLGAYVTVTEEETNYETTYKVGDVETEDRVAVFEEIVNSQKVEYTNHYNVTIDTGVALDSLPYILIIAVVLVGGVFLFLRKRKPQED